MNHSDHPQPEIQNHFQSPTLFKPKKKKKNTKKHKINKYTNKVTNLNKGEQKKNHKPVNYYYVTRRECAKQFQKFSLVNHFHFFIIIYNDAGSVEKPRAYFSFM